MTSARYDKNGIATALIYKRAKDYRRMENAIHELRLMDKITSNNYCATRSGREREMCAFVTLVENGIVEYDFCESSGGGVRRTLTSYSDYERYRPNNIYRCYVDKDNHEITEKEYDILCHIYGENYVKDVLKFKQDGFCHRVPNHTRYVYRINEENARKIEALVKTFDELVRLV